VTLQVASSWLQAPWKSSPGDPKPQGARCSPNPALESARSCPATSRNLPFETACCQVRALCIHLYAEEEVLCPVMAKVRGWMELVPLR
jgi:hypothetical protein